MSRAGSGCCRLLVRLLVPALGASLLTLAGCGSGDVSVYKSLSSTYVASPEVRTLVSEQFPPISRGSALAGQASLNGSSELVKSRLDGSVVLIGPVPAPEVARYVERIRDRLLARWTLTRMETPPRIEITASQSYTAESLADDTVQVSYGVLARARSEDEVAFVVGHELGHLLLQHQLRRQKTIDRTRVVTQVATSAGMIAAMYVGGKTVGNTTTVSSGLALGSLGGSVATNTAVAEVLTTLVDPGWGRRQEEQADLVGLDLATEAGYSPAEATNAFHAMENDEAAAKETAERLQQAEDRQPKSFTPQSLAAIAGNLWDQASAKWDSIRVNHPDTSAREAGLGEYRSQNYGVESARKPTRQSLEALHSSRAFQALKDAIDHALMASTALANKDATTALNEARAAQARVPNSWAPPYLAGLAALTLGRKPDAANLLVRATAVEGAPYPVYERAAFELVNMGQLNQAIRVMDSADSHLRDNQVTLPDRIVLYRIAGNEGQAQETEKTCAKVESSLTRDACTSAMLRPVEQARS